MKAGVFSVVKIAVYVFGLGASGANFEWLVYVAGFTIIAASIVALRSDNLKRRLAYSTVSQLSYIVLSVAVLAPLSIAAAALHIAAHAFGKITLFFAAGAIYTASGKTEVSQLDGIGRRMPWTLAAFGIASLSMIGLPPTAGMLSKWYMVMGAFDARHWFALAVIVASTLLFTDFASPCVEFRICSRRVTWVRVSSRCVSNAFFSCGSTAFDAIFGSASVICCSADSSICSWL